jgi:hypothetical protein
VAYWNLSSTFVGFTEVNASHTATLSTTVDTVVDLEIDAPNTGTASNAALAPSALAISGGFRVCDPNTAAVTDVGALVAQNTTDPSHTGSWFVRLIFPPQPSAVDVLILAWGIFAVFSAGTV